MFWAKLKAAAVVLVVAAVMGAGAQVAMSADDQGRKLPGSEIIPAERLGDWRPGVTVGVPGGIPTDRNHLIDVTKDPYNADSTGATDASVPIQTAINNAKEKEVVYLPPGTYRINSGLVCRNNVTIRGAGPDKTILMGYQPAYGILNLGGAADWWAPNRLKLDIAGSYKRGATELTVGDTKPLDGYRNGGIGELCQVSLKNDLKVPVMVPAGFEYMRKYITRIVAKTATTVTISPPLQFDLPAELAPVLRPGGGSANFVGIEDLKVDGANSESGLLISMTQCYGCWVKNVTVLNTRAYDVGLSDSLQCEIRHCHIGGRKGTFGPNGGGLVMGSCSSSLIEDNIITDTFPNININASSGNVIAYNFCDDQAIQGGLLGCSINSNHGAHPSFNLYEGNVCPRFQCDGYHGSASHDTAFRNRFHGTSTMTSRYWVCVNLNRFTRNYNLVGNILGSKGHDWLYEVGMTGFGYDKHYIYSLGFPNMGNGWCNGKTVQPSKGIYWADWDPVDGTSIKGTLTERTSDSLGKVTLRSGSVSVEQAVMLRVGVDWQWAIVRMVEGNQITVDTSPWGTKLIPAGTQVLLFPGPGGFQELDLDVAATTLRLGNYNYKDNGVPQSESLKGKQLPLSLYLTEKPEWFGNLSWPPFGPDTDFEKNKIPAQVRYEEMVKSGK